MRVLQVCHRFPPHPGGIEYHVQRLAKYLSANGHEVTVLTTSRDTESTGEEGGYTVIKLKYRFEPLRNPIPLKFPLKFRELSSSFDVIHMHSIYTFTTLSSFPFADKSRVVITLHGRAYYRGMASLLAMLHERLSFRMLKGASAFISLTELDRRLMMRRGIDGSKIKVIPNFVDLEEIDGIAKRCGAIDKDSEVQLLFVGSLVEAKNLESLLMDLRKLGGSVSLWVIGDGPLRAKLERLAGKNVKFLGRMRREDWIPYALSSDALVLPSKSEGFPTVVLEAMALRKPVIVSNIEVHKMLFGDVAIFYDPGNPKSLAKALEMLKDSDEKVKRGRRLIEELYDVKVVAKKIVELYEEVMSSSP